VQRAASLEQTQRDLGHLTDAHRELRGLMPGTATYGVRAQTHPAQGTSLKSGNYGACATQSISTNLTVRSSSTTIYSPTMYPPGNSCIELVTVYVTNERAVGAWDWCNGVTFRKEVPLDSNFVSTYTDGASNYTARVYRTAASGNSWTAYLLNYRTNAWDSFYTSRGTSQTGRDTGWVIDEEYSDINGSTASACADRAGKRFESQNISVYNGSGWVTASSANADGRWDGGSFYCSTRTFKRTDWSHWRADG